MVAKRQNPSVETSENNGQACNMSIMFTGLIQINGGYCRPRYNRPCDLVRRPHSRRSEVERE